MNRRPADATPLQREVSTFFNYDANKIDNQKKEELLLWMIICIKKSRSRRHQLITEARTFPREAGVYCRKMFMVSLKAKHVE